MKKLAVLQVDGLSYPVLHKAVWGGFMPFVASLLASGWKSKEIFSGLPSTTPASQFRLFYGLEDVVIGFRFMRRKKHTFFTPLQDQTIEQLESEFAGRSKTPFLSGGTNIVSIFRGGATTCFSARTMRRDSTTQRHILRYSFHPLRFLYIIFKIITLLLIEQSEHRKNRHRHHNIRVRVQNIWLRIMYEGLVGELAFAFSRQAMSRGDSVVYADFTGYDHLAHHYGPESRFPFYYLTVVDLYVKKLLTDPDIVSQRYDFVLLSDHGQSQATPIASLHNGLELKDCIAALFPGVTIADERDEAKFSFDQLKDLYALSSGGLCLIYGKAGPGNLESAFPEFCCKVSGIAGVGAVLMKTAHMITVTAGGRKLSLEDAEAALPEFTLLTGKERKQVVSSLVGILSSEDAPDAILISAVNKGNVVNFEHMFGTHGGFGGNQTKSFCMSSSIDFTHADDITGVNRVLYAWTKARNP